MKRFDINFDKHTRGCSRAFGVTTHTAHGYREIEVHLWWATVYLSVELAGAAREGIDLPMRDSHG